jgi:iron complex outermembrane recepter protein
MALTRQSWCLFLLLLLSSPLHGAAERRTPRDWLEAARELEDRLDLSSSDSAQLEQVRAALQTLRLEMLWWLETRHDEQSQGAPAIRALRVAAGSRAELKAAVQILRATAERLRDKRPATPFELGEIRVTVSAAAPSLASSERLTSESLRFRLLENAAEALSVLPGVSPTRIGVRNEMGIHVRGFDARQVPLFIDGVPVYVPYDGTVDLGRFTTFDVAEVQLGKGYVSPLYGPNAMGGAINLVSRRPASGFQGELGAGWGSGRTGSGHAQLGVGFDKWYLQAGGAWLQSSHFPLSDNFRPTSLQAGGRRDNSDSRDAKASFRLGYAPNERDEYAFSVASQRGSKGTPPYAGIDPQVRARFWRWPDWNKASIYFNSTTALDGTRYMKVRAYYDSFENRLDSYDDMTYTTQTRPYAFRSFYDDYSAGGSVEFGLGNYRKHNLRSAIHWKDEIHRENNLGEPVRRFHDRILSLALEDGVALGTRLSLQGGVALDFLETLQAQDFQQGGLSEIKGSSVASISPQILAAYSLPDTGVLRLVLSRKTRLPVMKDRYSYRLGQGLPNPDLHEETSTTLEVGGTAVLAQRAVLEVAVFRSAIDGLAQPFFVAPNLYQLQNIEDITAAGVEFSVTGRIFSQLEGSLAYTYLNRKNRSEPAIMLTEVPRHRTVAALGWRWRPRWTFGADLEYETGRYHLNQAGRVYALSAFALLDVFTRVALTERTEMHFGMENILDRNYQLSEGYPEPGRSAFVNLRYRF